MPKSTRNRGVGTPMILGGWLKREIQEKHPISTLLKSENFTRPHDFPENPQCSEATGHQQKDSKGVSNWSKSMRNGGWVNRILWERNCSRLLKSTESNGVSTYCWLKKHPAPKNHLKPMRKPLPGNSLWPFWDGEFTWPELKGCNGDLQTGDEKFKESRLGITW